MNNKSYQNELDRYFHVINHSEIPERVLFKGDLSKARVKLKHDAFIELNDHVAQFFYERFHPETGFGFNLLSIDRTTLRVSDETEMLEHFGGWTTTKGEKKLHLKARASQMFDVFNKITVGGIISPKRQGERELAAFHFLKLQPQDLILLDRGYGR